MMTLATSHRSWSIRAQDTTATRENRTRPRPRPRPLPGLAEALDDRRVRHAAALAHRLEAVATSAALELVEERRHQAGTRAAERVTEGDRAAVHVHLAHVGVVLLLPRQHDRGERLVDLDE